MYLQLFYLMYVAGIKFHVLKLVLCRVKDKSTYIIRTCRIQDFYVVHDTQKLVQINLFGSFAVKHNKELWKIILWIWTPRGCYELDLVVMPIEICRWQDNMIQLKKTRWITLHFIFIQNTKRLLWIWSSCPRDKNMLVDKSTRSSSKAPLGTHSLSSRLL